MPTAQPPVVIKYEELLTIFAAFLRKMQLMRKVDLVNMARISRTSYTDRPPHLICASENAELPMASRGSLAKIEVWHTECEVSGQELIKRIRASMVDGMTSLHPLIGTHDNGFVLRTVYGNNVFVAYIEILFDE